MTEMDMKILFSKFKEIDITFIYDVKQFQSIAYFSGRMSVCYLFIGWFFPNECIFLFFLEGKM